MPCDRNCAIISQHLKTSTRWFRISRESRQAAMEIFPIRLNVCYLPPPCSCDDNENCLIHPHEEVCWGSLYVSGEHDIFVLGLDFGYFYDQQVRARKHFYSELSSAQCAQVKNMMEVEFLHLPFCYEDHPGAHSDGEGECMDRGCAIAHAAEVVKHRYHHGIFPHIETCWHVWVDTRFGLGFIRDVMYIPSKNVLENWDHNMRFYEVEEMTPKAELSLQSEEQL